jgi:GWxTD domain-containing protein
MNGYAQLDFLPLSADYATFISSGDKTYTEIYVAFYQSDLTYQVEDTLHVAHFTNTLKISVNDSVIQNAERRYKNSERIGAKVLTNRQFMDVFAFEFEPGTYELELILIDEVAQKNGEYKMTLDIPEYGSELAISHIELATRINKATVKSNFTSKNNMEIIPHPSAQYGISQPLLYFYFEVYNLELNDDGNNRYNYHYYISDTDGQTVREFPEKIKSSSSSIIAESGGSNIITLSSNDYFLNVEIEDILSGGKVFARKKFRIDKPSKDKSDPQVPTQIAGYELYMNFSQEELIDEFEKSTYIAISEEIDIFEDLDEEGMKRFLAEFWKRRDPDPTTEINEYKQIYFKNLEYAEANFSKGFRAGWKTDRGRVMLIYGNPDEVERFPSSIDSAPYEIWNYYSLEGGSYFIFSDLTGHGSFELLHSNYRNEIKDPNWRQRVGGQEGFNIPGFD